MAVMAAAARPEPAARGQEGPTMRTPCELPGSLTKIVRGAALTVGMAAGLVIALGTGAAPASADGVTLAIAPEAAVYAPGDSLTVDLQVPVAGEAFNAYTAVVTYDPARLRLLTPEPITGQEGPLMTGACPERFHVFTIAGDSTAASIDHGLLCAGTTVTGPGTVYRLRFEALHTLGETTIGLAPETAFFAAGAFVTPVVLEDAVVTIDASVAVDGGGDDAGADAPPAALGLAQNAPNPFNPATTIHFTIGTPGHVALEVFDLRGRRIDVLVAGRRPAGTHAVVFDGRGLPSGTYLYRLTTGERIETRTMQLVK
jgi:hypothetical protein